MKWTPVRIPTEMFNEISQILEQEKFWVNEHEFIRDAVREKIMAIRKKEKNPKKEASS